MKDLSLLHIALIYLAVIRSSLLALLAMNVVTFFMYGMDKWRSTSGRLLPKGRKKAKKSKWRISEATLLGMAVIGGSIGAWLGMKICHHKTLHKKFRYGIPLILIAQIALLFFTSCKTMVSTNRPKQNIETALPMQHEYEPEHSPSVLIVMYDQEIGKEPLLKAIEKYKAEIIYDYSIIPGMAIKKPDDKTLEETMQYFKKVNGVVSVEYDHIYHLTDPVKPKLEIK